jgi:hypothetical protein
MPRAEVEGVELEVVAEGLPAAAGCTRCIPPGCEGCDAGAGIAKIVFGQSKVTQKAMRFKLNNRGDTRP